MAKDDIEVKQAMPALDRSKPDDIRMAGWLVAVHNDYRINGQFHTFWLFTRDQSSVKGEGPTDRAALDQVRQQLTDAQVTNATVSALIRLTLEQRKHVFSCFCAHCAHVGADCNCMLDE